MLRYASTTRRVTLRPLNGDTAGDHLLAVIPTPGTPGHFTTVELRHRMGFDRNLPGNGANPGGAARSAGAPVAATPLPAPTRR